MAQQLQSPTKVMQLLEGNFNLAEPHLDALSFQQLSADQLQASQDLQSAQQLQLAQALQAQQQLQASQALTAQHLQSLLASSQLGAPQALQSVQQQLQASQQLQLPGLEAQLTQQLQQAQQLQAHQQLQADQALQQAGQSQQQQAPSQLEQQQQQLSQAFQTHPLLASQSLHLSDLHIQQLAQQLANAQQLQASQGLATQQLAQSLSAQQLPHGLTAQQLTQGLHSQQLSQSLNAQQLPRLQALAALGGSQAPDVTQQMLAAVGLPTQSTAPPESSARMTKGARPASAKDCKVCSKCSLEKPTGEFWKDKTKPDGLYSQCTACAAQREESRRRKMAEEGASRPPLTSKKCSRCHQEKPASDFCANKRSPDGLYCQCKACVAVKDKERRIRLMASQQPSVNQKQCPCCGAVKSSEDFYRDKTAADGLQTYCKPCVCLKHKTVREKKRQKTQEDKVTQDKSMTSVPALTNHSFGHGPLQPSPPQIYPKMEMITLPGGGKLNVAEYVTPGHHTGAHIANFQFPSQTLRYLEPQPSRVASASHNHISQGQMSRMSHETPQQMGAHMNEGTHLQHQDAGGDDGGQENSMQEDGAFPGGLFTIEGHALMMPNSQGGNGVQQHQQLPHMTSSFSSEAYLQSGLPSATSHAFDAGLLNHLSGLGHLMGPQTPQSSNPLQIDSINPSPQVTAVPETSSPGQPSRPGSYGDDDPTHQIGLPDGTHQHHASAGLGSGSSHQHAGGHQSSERIRRQQAILDQCLGPLGSPTLQHALITHSAAAPSQLPSPLDGSKDTETDDTLEDLGISSPPSVAASDLVAATSQPPQSTEATPDSGPPLQAAPADVLGIHPAHMVHPPSQPSQAVEPTPDSMLTQETTPTNTAEDNIAADNTGSGADIVPTAQPTEAVPSSAVSSEPDISGQDVGEGDGSDLTALIPDVGAVKGPERGGASLA